MGNDIYRIAPSNTGLMHIGNARTFVFNYLLARASGSKFILRIEDTDLARSKPEYTYSIISSLKWLGIEWDEFHQQSERIDIYSEYTKHLISTGRAYNEDGAIKFRLNKNNVVVDDLIKGKVNFDLSMLEDIILVKSDGSASFHWANVVDDHTMGITHVIRGEDHLPNTPKHIQLYEAMGWKPPKYGHLGMILGMDKAKLGKRNGAKSIEQFQMEGYLPKAVFNYLALLGWSNPTQQEIMSKEELIKIYTIDRVSKSNSIFDQTKLEWVNREYIRNLSHDELATYIPNNDIKLAKLIQEKLTTLNDIDKYITFTKFPIFHKVCPDWMVSFTEYFRDTTSSLKSTMEEFNEIPKNDLYSSVRYALTAQESGLPLFDVYEYLGKNESLRRMKSWMEHSFIATSKV